MAPVDDRRGADIPNKDDDLVTNNYYTVTPTRRQEALPLMLVSPTLNNSVALLLYGLVRYRYLRLRR